MLISIGWFAEETNSLISSLVTAIPISSISLSIRASLMNLFHTKLRMSPSCGACCPAYCCLMISLNCFSFSLKSTMEISFPLTLPTMLLSLPMIDDVLVSKSPTTKAANATATIPISRVAWFLMFCKAAI